MVRFPLSPCSASKSPSPQSSLVPFLLPVWLLTQQASAAVRLDGEAALLACQVHTAGRGVTSSTPVHILPQGSVQLQQEEPRGLWGRATLLTVSACSLPEFGWKQPHKVFALMNQPKLIGYLLCARSRPGLARSAVGCGFIRVEALYAECSITHSLKALLRLGLSSSRKAGFPELGCLLRPSWCPCRKSMAWSPACSGEGLAKGEPSTISNSGLVLKSVASLPAGCSTAWRALRSGAGLSIGGPKLLFYSVLPPGSLGA